MLSHFYAHHPSKGQPMRILPLVSYPYKTPDAFSRPGNRWALSNCHHTPSQLTQHDTPFQITVAANNSKANQSNNKKPAKKSRKCTRDRSNYHQPTTTLSPYNKNPPPSNMNSKTICKEIDRLTHDVESLTQQIEELCTEEESPRSPSFQFDDDSSSHEGTGNRRRDRVSMSLMKRRRSC